MNNTTTATLAAHDETIITETHVIHLTRTGRGYFCDVENVPTIKAFACTRSYALASVREQLEALRSAGYCFTHGRNNCEGDRY